MMNKTYRVIGLMSGTSLDGLDLAYCEFSERNGKWKYSLLVCDTLSYPEALEKALKNAHAVSGLDLATLDVYLGEFMGGAVNRFNARHGLTPELIGSHGHTIFHTPGSGLTLQIGNGASIAASTGIDTVNDFRRLDVALGGQGAPLVPIGDRHLFGSYDACINIGGFANISFETEAGRLAYDICPVNFGLNAQAARLGLPYDKDGEIARQVKPNSALLEKLDSIEYYCQNSPRSLGREWYETHIEPLLAEFGLSAAENIATLTAHAANQISQNLPNVAGKQVLITGGGACNQYLIECIARNTLSTVTVPDENTVKFKEALVFAFLAVLRLRGENNCLASVTGASRDSCGGTLHKTNDPGFQARTI